MVRGSSAPVRRVQRLAMLVVCCLLATAASAVAPATPATEARLRIVIETSANRASVGLTPGTIAAFHVVSAPVGVTVNQHATGVAVRSVRPMATVVVDLVFAESTGSDIDLDVWKSRAGTVAVGVTNLNGEGRYVVRAVDDRTAGVTETEPLRWTIPAAELFGHEPLALPHADGRRLTLAFYYPWWESYEDPKVADQPAKPRSTQDAADVLEMTEQARAAGIDGFVSSWAGSHKDGPGLDLALDAASRTGGVVAGYLEVAEAAAASSSATEAGAIVRLWLHQLLARASHPAYLRAHGQPVVFVFAMSDLPASEWRNIRRELRLLGMEVRLVGDATGPGFAALTWGEHDYSPIGTEAERAEAERQRALRTRAEAAIVPGAWPRLHVATVSPGLDDRGVRSGNEVIEREDGARYDATWRAATAADPDWIVVTSWNEWFEGTAVEPSVLHGDRALLQTRAWADAWG